MSKQVDLVTIDIANEWMDLMLACEPLKKQARVAVIRKWVCKTKDCFASSMNEVAPDEILDQYERTWA